LKIPFIIYNPILREKGLRKKEPATILDIAPTVLGMMGWPKLSFHQGTDLLGKKKRKSHIILLETYRPESTKDRFSALSYPWHLLFSPQEKRFELYNLSSDPGEKNDVYERDKLSSPIVDLQNTLKSLVAKILLEKKDIQLDPESLEMLRSLGYIKE